MLLLKIWNQVSKIVVPIVDRVELNLKAWTKPVSEALSEPGPHIIDL